jgi:hypothetical protein
MKITTTFIKKWSSEYLSESSEIDASYQHLLNKTELELVHSKSISFDLFMDIVIWKSERIKSIVRKHINEIGYEPYSDAIQILHEKRDVRYVPFLTSLYGINYPTASAIGHFVCPATYPIIDYRVVEALIYLKRLPKRNSSFYTTTPRGYTEYYTYIHQIASLSPQRSLRKIDEALFMFHKKNKITV